MSKFYVVWQGHQPGIYASWAECEQQVKGFPNAQYKGFETRAEAESAAQGQYADYMGKPTSSLTPEQLQAIGQPQLDSYAVDVACSNNPGRMEFRCVHTRTKEMLFQKGPFEQGTNNIGEFLAIAEALMQLKAKGNSSPIYSDSENAIAWIKAKRCKTRLLPSATNAPLFELINRAETWLRTNTYPNRILKWETAAWGEIPADYGRK